MRPPPPGPPGCPSRSGRSRMPPSTEPGAGAIGIREIEGVFRAEDGRAVAVLTRVFGSIDVAEDAVQEAFAAAVATWPATGRSPAPAVWVFTSVSRLAIVFLR